MAVPESTFAAGNLAPLGLVLAAVLCVQLISPNERRLVSGTALLLAGVLFFTRGSSLVPLVAAVALTGAGAVLMLRAAVVWDDDVASRIGPVAAFLLLPPAFFGAILLVGVVLSALAAPARLLARVFGG